MGCVRWLNKETGTINKRHLPRATTTPVQLAITELIHDRHIRVLHKKKIIWTEISLCRRILLQYDEGWTLTPTEKLLTVFFSNSANNCHTCKKLISFSNDFHQCSMHFNFNAFISTYVKCTLNWWKALRNSNAALFTVIDKF